MPENEDDTTTAVEDTATTEGQEPDDTTATDTTEDTTDTGDAVDQDDDTADVETLRATIARLRKENAKARTGAKEAAAKKARDEALAEAQANLDKALAAKDGEWKTKVAKALGLVEDEPELTPEQVAEKITAERDEAKQQAEARAAEYTELLREVAVQDAANAHDADPGRLLDSRRFMAEIAKLDPSDRGAFRAAVMDAVKTAVEDDTSLKATQRPTPPAASGGTTVAGTKPRDIDDMSIEDMVAAGFTKRR